MFLKIYRAFYIYLYTHFYHLFQNIYIFIVILLKDDINYVVVLERLSFSLWSSTELGEGIDDTRQGAHIPSRVVLVAIWNREQELTYGVDLGDLHQGSSSV